MSAWLVAFFFGLGCGAIAIGLWSEFRGIDRALNRAVEMPDDYEEPA